MSAANAGPTPDFASLHPGYTPMLSISRVFPSFAATSSRTGPSVIEVTGCSVAAWRASR